MSREFPSLEYVADVVNKSDDVRTCIGAMSGVNDKIEEAKQRPRETEVSKRTKKVPEDLVSDIRSKVEGRAISNKVANQAKRLEEAIKERMQEGGNVQSAELTDNGYKINNREDEGR